MIAAAAISTSTAIFSDTIPVIMTIDNQTGKTIPSSSVTYYATNIAINDNLERDYPVGKTNIQMTIQSPMDSDFGITIGNHVIHYIDYSSLPPIGPSSCYNVTVLGSPPVINAYNCYYASDSNVEIARNTNYESNPFNVSVVLK